ncbi:hypothetical protein [Maribacter sp. Asnod1-A12]|uniref:hypothetical protein n=1 Tax=Maribacter sp. Asnod1-A12 TaxID=3160576 RepID=UPI003864BD60
MHKALFFITFLFFSFASFAQENSLKILNKRIAKEITIKENKRITIRTHNGEKISGRFTIFDEQSIEIKNQNILISDIVSIKKNPLLLSLFTNGLLVYIGLATIAIGTIAGIFGESSAFLLTIPGAAIIYAGVKGPNFLKNYKTNKEWSFKTMSIPQ